MILVAHLVFVLLSFASLLAAIAGKFRSGQAHSSLLKLTGISSLGVLVTGVSLVMVYHASISAACLAGGVYLVSLAALYEFYRKLATS